MSIRDRLAEEIHACRADSARPLDVLKELSDEFAVSTEFRQTMLDHLVENDAIMIISQRETASLCKYQEWKP